jgi:hypothetical protein
MGAAGSRQRFIVTGPARDARASRQMTRQWSRDRMATKQTGVYRLRRADATSSMPIRGRCAAPYPEWVWSSLRAARFPAARASASHMYAPRLVCP